jgi:hypothetical protein
MNKIEPMETIIQQILNQQNEINDFFGSDLPPVLRSPAPAGAIERIEQVFQFKLPPSFREFLTLYDGCMHFTGSLDLLGSQEILSSTYLERVRQIRADEWDSGNRVPLEGFVIGYSSESSYVLLIDRTIQPDENGELPVVLWQYEQISRSRDFRSFLKFWREVNEKKLQTLRSTTANNSSGR